LNIASKFESGPNFRNLKTKHGSLADPSGVRCFLTMSFQTIGPWGLFPNERIMRASRWVFVLGGMLLVAAVPAAATGFAGEGYVLGDSLGEGVAAVSHLRGLARISVHIRGPRALEQFAQTPQAIERFSSGSGINRPYELARETFLKATGKSED
jgi:hypothetical protein